MDYNKIMLGGRVTAKPKMKEFENGNKVCEFTLAESNSWTEKTGEKKKKSRFHQIKAWNKLGENCFKNLDKGSEIFIEGRQEIDVKEDPEGKKSYYYVTPKYVQFIGEKVRQDADGNV